MNKLMDLEETRKAEYRKTFKQCYRLYFKSQGCLLNLYYRFLNVKFCFTRVWEYPWALINSEVKKGDIVLDAGCGSSPLLFYLHERGCSCHGIDLAFRLLSFRNPDILLRKR